MRTSSRSRAVVPVIVVIVVLLVGFFAMRSSGSDNKDAGLDTVERTTNCSPVARADAAATHPGETVLVDVLANDTDADGDSLVFQILKTEGGASEIDDADTPTDSSDDRLAFTPGEPPADNATVEYQALDPQGGFSTATLTVAVNPDAVLPDGVRSALASDPAAEGTGSGRCGDTSVATTSTTLETGPVGPETEAVDTTTTVVINDDNNTDITTRRRTSTTRKSTSSNRTTTTARRSSGGTSPGTTSPRDQPPANDGSPSVPAPGDPGSGNTTTTKPSSPPPTDPTCGSPQTNPNYRECIANKSQPTSTTRPTPPPSS